MSSDNMSTIVSGIFSKFESKEKQLMNCLKLERQLSKDGKTYSK